MGCGGCRGGHDPYAAYRNRGRRMARGTSVGVTKSAARIAREAGGENAVPSKREAAIKAIAEQNKELVKDIPANGIVKKKKAKKLRDLESGQ